MPDIIYRNWNSGLGDTWATIQLLARMRMPRCGPVFLSSRQHGEDLKEMQDAILSNLNRDHGCGCVIPVDWEPNTELDGYAVWAAPVIPTTVQWAQNEWNRQITVQFDGKSTPELKNAPPADVLRILDWAERHDLKVVTVGKNLGLEKSIWAMKQSVLFVGVDSGMSHVAHSVGVPTYILEYDLPVVTCHRHRNYVLCRGSEHFTAQAENYLTYLRFIDRHRELPS